jgi:CHASE3 domain sensor protein
VPRAPVICDLYREVRGRGRSAQGFTGIGRGGRSERRGSAGRFQTGARLRWSEGRAALHAASFLTETSPIAGFHAVDTAALTELSLFDYHCPDVCRVFAHGRRQRRADRRRRPRDAEGARASLGRRGEGKGSCRPLPSALGHKAAVIAAFSSRRIDLLTVPLLVKEATPTMSRLRLSLEARVRLGFFSAVALVIVIGLLAFVYLGRMSHEVQEVLKKDVLLARAGDAIKLAFLETRRAEKNYLAFGQDRDIREYEFLVAQLKAALQEGMAAARKGETREKYRAIERYLQRYEQTFSRLLTIPSEAQSEIRRMSQELGDIGQRISTLADEIAAARWAEFEMHTHDADRIETVAKRKMGVIVAMTGIGSLLLGLYVPRKVALPIRQLSALLDRAHAETVRGTVDVPSDGALHELAARLRAALQAKGNNEDKEVR